VPHLLFVPPAEPGGWFPAVSFQPRVNSVGPELGAIDAAAEVQVPLGPPAGHGIETEFPPAVSVSDAVEQLSEVPPELVKAMLATSWTEHELEEEMKFENVPLGALGHPFELADVRATSFA